MKLLVDDMMMNQLKVISGGKECCVMEKREIDQREYDNSRKRN